MAVMNLSASIILAFIFIVATVFTILSIVMRGKKTAKVFNILIVVFSSISILLTATFSLMTFVTGGSISHSYFENPIEAFNNNAGAVDYSDSDSSNLSTEELYSNQIKHLANLGYSNINMHMADVCDAEGIEAICFYKNGDEQKFEIYAIKNGYITNIYTKDGSASSIYLLELDGKTYILDYSQSLSDNSYTQNYGYTLFRFDDSFTNIIKDKKSISVSADDSSGGSKGSEFFSQFNNYLANATVCYDNYGLNGYGTPNSSQNNLTPGTKYLNITNCNTNKVGIVNIKDEKSWLNLRSGPSKKDKLVLIDPSDKYSYVKQSKNSLLTVVEPYNTNDSKNPIWYKVRVSYGNRVIEGYSSQNYIKVENMTKISKGKSFTVSVSTNDTGVRFSCNDTSIATIDPITGEMTGKQKGIVLITVTTDSGLTDSCLINIA